MTLVDKIFRDFKPQAGDFKFDEKVACVFDDMVSRSVPLYADVQRLVPVLAGLLDHETLRVVDLGCSTGTSLIHLAQSLSKERLELIGVDNSASMLDKCEVKLKSLDLESKVELVNSSIEEFQFRDASAVLMNYTLQFVPLERRPALLEKICASIRPGGFLLVSEKIAQSDEQLNDAMVELYFDFKRRQGYSELEISRKRDALENVLVPLELDRNIELLKNAGFGRIELALKWFNFATLVAYVPGTSELAGSSNID